MPDEPSFDPPTAHEVVGRTFVLTVLQIRLIHEAQARSVDPEERRTAQSKNAGLAGFSPMFKSKNMISLEETRLLDANLGSWTDRDGINTDWRGECIGILGWALGIEQNILPFDTKFEVMPKVYMDKMVAFVKNGDASLRSQEEINTAQGIAQMWHWRARTTRIIREGRKAPPGTTFPEIIRVVSNGSYERGWIPVPISNDFPLFGKPYRDLSEDEYHFATSIAMERHYALNWLCGYSNDWDNVPTDT